MKVSFHMHVTIIYRCGYYFIGLEKQLERIPMRFIEEQLRDQKKIVLTGK